MLSLEVSKVPWGGQRFPGVGIHLCYLWHTEEGTEPGTEMTHDGELSVNKTGLSGSLENVIYVCVCWGGVG